MKWEEYVNSRREKFKYGGYELTDIECPECGENIYRDKGLVLTSYPAQRRYVCMECGWEGVC